MHNERLKTFEIKVENHLAYSYNGVLSFGACLPADIVRDSAELHLEDREGNKHPLQWRTLLHKENDAVSWALFDFSVALRKREFCHFRVCSGALSPESAKSPRLIIEASAAGIYIRNGEEEWRFQDDAPLGLVSFERAGVLLLESTTSAAEMEFATGSYRVRKPVKVALHSANNFVVVAQAEAKLQSDNGDNIDLRLRFRIEAGKCGCNVNALFSNRRESDEELLLNRFALRFGLSTPVTSCLVRQAAFGNDCSPRDYEIEGDVEIRNGAITNFAALQIPEEKELWPFFRKRDWKTYFRRVEPFCGVRNENGGVLFAWQRATNLGARSFLTQEKSACLELVSGVGEGYPVPQGFSRSFDFSITPFGANDDGESVYRLAAQAEYSPLVSVYPQWFIDNRVEEMERILPFRPDLHPRYEKQLWREYAIDYFSGFYHFGDYPSGRGPLQTRVEARDFTWNNNEEDHLKGIAWMLMRTGDPSYREDLQMCARHLIEVDRIAHSSHALQNGVLIAHAKNHFDGAGYPSHCWAEGLLLYYKLSGDDDALDTFLKLCDCLLLWTTRQPERKRFTDAREMGVPVTNFAHAYKITGAEKYLNAARIYIAHWQRQMDEDGGLYYKKGAHFIPYAEYVAVEALWDFYELIGGEDVQALLLRVIEWIASTQLDCTGIYDGRSTSEAFLHVFYIAFKLTGDEAWLERGRRGLDAALSQSALHSGMKFNNNGAFYHEALKRGWFRDDLVPLEPCQSSRAVFRTYSEPLFGWEKLR